MFILNIIVTRAFHPKFTNSLSKLPKVTIKAKSENIVTKFARTFDMTIWVVYFDEYPLTFDVFEIENLKVGNTE